MSNSVDYGQYEAKARRKPPGPLYSFVRDVYRFANVDVLHGTLLYPYGRMRHKALLSSANRSQSHTYTVFYRVPAQLEVLTGAVMDYLYRDRRAGERLIINLFACSTGAEAYTVASVLLKSFPQLDFKIHASDLHQEMVDKATAARYSRDEVLHSDDITDAFIESTFDRDGESFLVKPEVKSHVVFSQANLLDDSLSSRFQPADVVFVQNVLFHLDPVSARKAFANVTQFLKPKSALFVDGADLDLKVELTRAAKLEPLEASHREIYQQTRKHIGAQWWKYYYGAEPYSVFRRDRIRRYSTVYLKGSAKGEQRPD
jgi:chemotaxis protein methyltransferase CheR